jgi:hypothetical protein
MAVYTVTKLITGAYYTAGVLSRDFETITGAQLTEGLDLLNDALGMVTATKKLIPYYSKYDLSAVVGQEKYFIPNLIDVETFTFFIGNLRYPSVEISRRPYFGGARVNNINSLPFSWHGERSDGGMDIYLYFLPQQTFPLQIWGKFGLAEINDPLLDLSIIYERFYILYLRYKLAEFICNEYQLTMQPSNLQTLRELETAIITISPMDLTLQKASTFTRGRGMTWAQVNLGGGWTPT